MRGIVEQWVTAMKKGHLTKTEAWLVLQSALWHTLSCPLPAINLMKAQCKTIMAPAIEYVLNTMGVCKHFPRSLLFAPEKLFGLGISHIFFIQDIYRLQDIIFHTSTCSITGKLYKSTMELLIIELGSSLSLQELPFQEVKSLLINTLIKSSWDFLSSNNLYLRHDLEWSIPRENDTEIMTRFYLEKVPLDALSHINLC
jgi:hypothetical protein